MAIECDFLDILVLFAVIHRVDVKLRLAVFAHDNRNFVKDGTTKPILCRSRFYVVEAHGGQDVPGRHLTHILIARKSIRGCVILTFENLTHLVSRLPRLTRHGVEVDDVVAGFVAMNVLPNQARHVGRRVLAKF